MLTCRLCKMTKYYCDLIGAHAVEWLLELLDPP